MGKTCKAVLLISLMCGVVGRVMAGVPVVTNVVASQQESNKLVDIYYDVFDDEGDELLVRVEISDDAGVQYAVPAFTLSGDIGSSVETGANKHIVWDAGADWDGEYSEQMRVKVIAADHHGFPGLAWGNEVPSGGFLLGQDGGVEGYGSSKHVNIPWSYWLSKYEIRNDQYCDFLNTALAAGHLYLGFHGDVYAGLGGFCDIPAGMTLLRIDGDWGIQWRINRFVVVDGKSNFPVSVSWYGAMAFAQYYGYDLPTEAEWERAARGPDHEDAGTHQLFSWGNTTNGGYANYQNSGDPYDDATTPVGYFDGNQTPSGPDMTNAYGCYDMAGNVKEWCRTMWLDDVGSYPAHESLADGYNDISSEDSRVLRGGGYGDYPDRIECHDREQYWPSSVNWDTGFRVVRRSVSNDFVIPDRAYSETFEGAEWLPATNQSIWSVTNALGDWIGTNTGYRVDANAHSGERALHMGVEGDNDYGTLEIPMASGKPVGISCWARCTTPGEQGDIVVGEYGGIEWNYTDGESFENADMVKFYLTLQPSYGETIEKICIMGRRVYIDDVELYTVPE